MSEDRRQTPETEELELEAEDLEEEIADEADEPQDEGLEGDAGDAAGEGGERPARQDVGKPPSRGARRIASLSERARKAEQEAAEYRGRLQALEGRQTADPGAVYRQAQAEQEELARIATLPYEDQIRFHNQRTEHRVG